MKIEIRVKGSTSIRGDIDKLTVLKVIELALVSQGASCVADRGSKLSFEFPWFHSFVSTDRFRWIAAGVLNIIEQPNALRIQYCLNLGPCLWNSFFIFFMFCVALIAITAGTVKWPYFGLPVIISVWTFLVTFVWSQSRFEKWIKTLATMRDSAEPNALPDSPLQKRTH
jgi:hypothetical protein